MLSLEFTVISLCKALPLTMVLLFPSKNYSLILCKFAADSVAEFLSFYSTIVTLLRSYLPSSFLLVLFFSGILDLVSAVMYYDGLSFSATKSP